MNRETGPHFVNERLVVEAGEPVLHEAFNEQGNGRFLVQATAHEVVKLVRVHWGARSAVGSGHFISEDLEFGNGFGTRFFGEQEILEHLTRITVVGVFGNGEQTGGNGVALVVASCVNVERGICVRNVVVNLNVVIHVALSRTVHRNGLGESTA